VSKIKLNIAILGKEAWHFTDLFTEENLRLLKSHKDISSEDDFVFALSYPKLIPGEYLNRPRAGVLVNHSSDLPRGRGWAPIQWSVLKKLDQITVTLFRAVEEVDAGDWCFKERYSIEPYDTIYDLYEKDRIVTRRMLVRVVKAYKSGSLIFHKQEGMSEYWPKRKPKNSELPPKQSLSALWDYIRICNNEHYPAFFFSFGEKILVLHRKEYYEHSLVLDMDKQKSLSDVWERRIQKKSGCVGRMNIAGRTIYLEFQEAERD